jgi:hypothetical protein
MTYLNPILIKARGMLGFFTDKDLWMFVPEVDPNTNL